MSVILFHLFCRRTRRFSQFAFWMLSKILGKRIKENKFNVVNYLCENSTRKFGMFDQQQHIPTNSLQKHALSMYRKFMAFFKAFLTWFLTIDFKAIEYFLKCFPAMHLSFVQFPKWQQLQSASDGHWPFDGAMNWLFLNFIFSKHISLWSETQCTHPEFQHLKTDRSHI